MTCPVGPADACPRAERRRVDATVASIGVVSGRVEKRRAATRSRAARRRTHDLPRALEGDTAHVTRTGGRDPTPHASGSGVTEEAGLLARGSRLFLRLPDGGRRQWPMEESSPLTVAGAAPASVRREIPLRLTGVPFSSVFRRNHFAVARVRREFDESQGADRGTSAMIGIDCHVVTFEVARATSRPLSLERRVPPHAPQ